MVRVVSIKHAVVGLLIIVFLICLAADYRLQSKRDTTHVVVQPVPRKFERVTTEFEKIENKKETTHKALPHNRDNTEKSVDTASLPFHPFDNQCRFPVPNIHAKDHTWDRAERLRTLKCDTDRPMATQDSQGYMYIHPHFHVYPKKEVDAKCKVVIIEGGLRNATTNKGKNDYKEVHVEDGPENVRFWVNADAFFIRCFDKTGKKVLWEKPYPGLRDLDKPKNEITIVSDFSTIDEYGRRKPIPKPVTPSRYSIDILGFDSTARTMFYRHMPRTVDVMEKLGYVTLFGYNKIGDNSMVNLVPILAGDLKEALEEPKLDNSSDINGEWLMPTKRQLDPTLLPFLWKIMKGFGCKSMLNEDIGIKHRGLFHYPESEFKPGFTELPSDHYYRTYYLAVYEKWAYAQCKDGDQIQREFMDLWHKFANKYRDICHFGFTFVTTITHEDTFTIEPLDEHVSSKLENLHENGALDNSVSIIMGDHGNRIGLVQYSYTGRIEERMPLMSIRIPPSFIAKYPQLYQNFLENRYKLTSNFDVHQLLKDFVLMDFETKKRENERGISLLQEIPQNRSCFDACIPENFCTCLVDRSTLDKVDGKVTMKDNLHRKKKSLDTVKLWLKENLDYCLDTEDISLLEPFETLGLNIFAVHGLRSKANMTITEQVRNKPANYKYLHHEFQVSGKSRRPSIPLKMKFRVDVFISTDEYSVAFEPSMTKGSEKCNYKSLFDVCTCLREL